MLHLVQLTHPDFGRCVAVVEDEYLFRLNTFSSIYALAMQAIKTGISLESIIADDRSPDRMVYDPIYTGTSDWNLLPAFDHPEEPARCLVTGTGLTHKASVDNRQAMHEEAGHTEITDSMRIFQMGLEGGKPESGKIGVQPEWFYKGHGNMVKAHGEALVVPPFADDGGEEPEIAGVYIVGPDGQPYRIGLVMANEFSDHVMEKKNYLYLAPSKLRTCAIGPELVVGASFDEVDGTVSIHRNGEVTWSKAVKTGELNMSHSVSNLEYHHFKYPEHRSPGDAHIYFFGADAFSFGDGFTLEDGDEMVVAWEGFGRSLRNRISIDRSEEKYISVKTI